MLSQNKQKQQDKQYSSINLFLRSLIMFIYGTLSIIIHSTLTLCALPFPARYRYRIIHHFLKNYIETLKYICHIDYRVEGEENLPKNRAGIILSKHQSTWETFFLPQFFHEPAIILKRELLRIPFFGWGLAAFNPIAIDRNKKSSAMNQIIEKGKVCLDKGRWILVFPEGTRVPYGTVGKYKLGGARLAAETGYPVLPIAHNAGRFWPKKTFIKHPGTVRVIIGPLIESQGRSADEILQLAKNWIETTMSTIDR